PNTGPVYYGIAPPPRAELTAATHDHEPIRRHLGVDTLGYLSVEGMRRAVGGRPWPFCDAGFTGHYSTSIPEAGPPTHEPAFAAPVNSAERGTWQWLTSTSSPTVRPTAAP